MRNYPIVFFLAVATSLGGCGNGQLRVLDHNAVSSTAPGAPGYLVIGLAQFRDQPPISDVIIIQSMTVQFDDATGRSHTVRRFNCLAREPKPCRPLTSIDLQIFQLPPGQYHISNLMGQIDTQSYYLTITRRRTLQTRASSDAFDIRSGEINYVGDLLIDIDFETKRIGVRRYDLDRAKMREMLTSYPGLSGRQSANSIQPVAVP